MPAERIHVYVGEPLRRLLDTRADRDGASHAINMAADRYLEVCRRSLPSLSESEWMAVADALNGTGFHDAASLTFAWAEIADADRLRGLGATWGIDAQALAARLREAPYAELVAVVDLVERLWARPGEDWGALLRAWGALPDETEPRTGESTAPLTEDQVATLVDLVRADRREDYDALCAALGVLNGPALWEGLRRRLRTQGGKENRMRVTTTNEIVWPRYRAALYSLGDRAELSLRVEEIGPAESCSQYGDTDRSVRLVIGCAAHHSDDEIDEFAATRNGYRHARLVAELVLHRTVGGRAEWRWGSNGVLTVWSRADGRRYDYPFPPPDDDDCPEDIGSLVSQRLLPRVLDELAAQAVEERAAEQR